MKNTLNIYKMKLTLVSLQDLLMKRLALLSLLTLTLTACADRVRENCDTTKADGLLERRCQ
jgi:hypothetical protein